MHLALPGQAVPCPFHRVSDHDKLQKLEAEPT